MTVWIEDLGAQFYGHAWAISSERHDGIVYVADSKEEAICKYERDRHVKVEKVQVM